MAKTRNQKQKLVRDYIEKINASKALFIIAPTQITPNEANTLRKQLKESNASFNVVKNSLFKIALKKTQKELDDISLSEENAAIFIQGEASESAKVLYNFLEDIKKGKIKGGLLDNTPLGTTEIEELAKLPPKDELIATTVRTIGAPLTNFARVLNANILSLVNVLKNIGKEESK